MNSISDSELEKRIRFSEKFSQITASGVVGVKFYPVRPLGRGGWIIRIQLIVKKSARRTNGGVTALAVVLARAEWRDAGKLVPCFHCPYISLSHHEASLHARFHPKHSVRSLNLAGT